KELLAGALGRAERGALRDEDVGDRRHLVGQPRGGTLSERGQHCVGVVTRQEDEAGGDGRQRPTSAHVLRGAFRADVLNTTLILRRWASVHALRVGWPYSSAKSGLPARANRAY